MQLPRRVSWVLGDQCYYWSPFWSESRTVVMWEGKYFSSRFPYHRMKLWYLYSSMRLFAEHLRDKEHTVHYFSLRSQYAETSLKDFVEAMADGGVEEIDLFVPSSSEDYLVQQCRDSGIAVNTIPDQPFLSSPELKDRYFVDKQKFSFLPFYKAQRKELDLLLDQEGQPLGGSWTYDTENRKALPKNIELPKWHVSHSTSVSNILDQAREDVLESFPDHPGEMHQMCYPVTRAEAKDWLDHFLAERLELFGTYEDAIDRDSNTVFHSVLSMCLNNGILHPDEVITETMTYWEDHQDEISLNQIEGFLRQIIGWREYIKNVYDVRGVSMKQDNYFQFDRKIPESFWTGETGIEPIDNTIQKVLETGYAHHIERLMILGNFMLLCEFDPAEVNDWFQALFVDAYEWVMIPNVIGMSQYADGGRMMTKPYISSSNYVLKMSNYQKDGHWDEIWDALFWRFIGNHRDVLKDQARMHFMVANWDKKSSDQKQKLLDRAEEFLESLD